MKNEKSILKVLTCGSVDDGKSTLIGRLLYDSKMLFEDQIAQAKNETKKYGTVDGEIDFALLVDGLQSEREQGITIDVAYRFFSTKNKKYIIIDAPGHEQYTRNMVTGASNADVAVILIDARKGVLTQTKRHSFIISLLGIKYIIVAINKMDLVNYSQDIFEKIKKDYLEMYEKLRFSLPYKTYNPNIKFIPISALRGDNVVENSKNMLWYNEESILEYLDNNSLKNDDRLFNKFIFPVQYINRTFDFRGYAGNVVSGEIRVEDKIKILPSNIKSAIKEIIYDNKKKDFINGKLPITIRLSNEIDISRGDLIVKDNETNPYVNDSFEAMIVWMDENELYENKQYILKIYTKEVNAKISKILFKRDINSLEKQKSNSLNLNDIGRIKMDLSEKIAFELYENIKEIGSFILIDKFSNNTVAAGMIVGESTKELKEEKTIIPFKHKITRKNREIMKNQKAIAIWLTGLSGSGKSTIANELEFELYKMGYHTYILDGDNIRSGLNSDLGFSYKDRDENIRRFVEVAKLFVDAGIITIIATISPLKKHHKLAKEILKDDLISIFVDTPLELCIKRDTKGLYKKALNNEIKNFTGISSEYEQPTDFDIRIDTTDIGIKKSVDSIVKLLKKRNICK